MQFTKYKLEINPRKQTTITDLSFWINYFIYKIIKNKSYLTFFLLLQF